MIRRTSFIIGFIGIIFLFTSNSALAKGGIFGMQETIHKIEDIPLKGANGEDLYLGYKTSTFFVLAGVYMTDDGYVLGVSGQSNSYYSLPDKEKLAQFQEARLIPQELPPYQIPLIEYLFGYSLWLLIAGSILYYWIKDKFFGKREEPEEVILAEEKV